MTVSSVPGLKRKPEDISHSGLKGKRYWTPGMIRDLLGEPDKVVRNPHYSTAAPMRLYLLARVCAMEEMLDTDAMRKARERRSAAGRKAADTRQDNARRAAETCDMRCVFTEPLAAVYARGAESNRAMAAYYEAEYEAYVERCERRGEEPEPRRGTDYPEVDAGDRWAINYLRHERTDYDRLLAGFGSWAREILRRRVHEEIGRAYPELADAAEDMV